MKKLLLLLSFTSATLVASYAQNSVGIGTTTPDPNAVLDLQSPTSDQGILVPRLTTAQRTGMALAAAQNGLLVYDADLSSFYYWDGAALGWTQLGGGTDADWVENADTIYNNTHWVAIGTNSPLPYVSLTVDNDGKRSAIAGYSTGDGATAIGVEGFSSGAPNANVGVYGGARSTSASDTVAGVIGEAENIQNIGVGIRGLATTGAASTQAIGGSFEANDVNGNANSIQAVVAEGFGDGGSTNQVFGLYANATGGVNGNYAGYFNQGDVIVASGKVGIQQISPISALQIGDVMHLDLVDPGVGWNYNLFTNNLLFNGSNWIRTIAGLGGTTYLGNGEYGIELYGTGAAGSPATNSLAQFQLDSNTARIRTYGVGSRGLELQSDSDETLILDLPYSGGQARAVWIAGDNSRVGIRAPLNTTAGDYNLTLPLDAGTNGYVLTTDGTGALSWTSPAAGGTDWSLAGNAGTTAGADFLGTTDAADFEIKTNGVTAITVESTQQNVGIGIAPSTTASLFVRGDDPNNIGIDVDNTYTGANTSYGINILINNTATASKTGVATTVYSGTSINTIYGVNNIVTANTTGTGVGTRNYMAGTGNGSIYGTYNWFANTGSGSHVGMYNYLQNNSTGSKIGTWSELSSPAGGAGMLQGTRNNITNSGSGQSYGQRNFVYSTGSGLQTGTYNSLSNIGTSIKRGTHNVVDQSGGSNGSDLTGVHNTMSTSSSVWQSMYGMINTFSNNSPTGPSYGVYQTFAGTSVGTRYGIYSSGDNANYFTGYLDFDGALMPGGNAGANGEILTSQGAGAAPIWQAPAANLNIYNSDGSLTGNRIVAQGTNLLAFTSSATNGFSVDGTTFSIDAVNDRVGIGTTTPGYKFTIYGGQTSALAGPNLSFITDQDIYPTMHFLNWNHSEQWMLFNSYYDGLFRSSGTSNFSIYTNNYGNPGTLNFGYANGVAQGTNIAWVSGIAMTALGNVGIGTSAPSTKLHVDNGNVSPAFRLTDGTQAAGNILTSDANGNASWQSTASQSIVTGSGTATQVAFWNGTNSLTSNANLYWNNTSARLGIGTTTPAFKLSVHEPSTGTNYIHLTNTTTGEGSGNGLLLGTNGSNMLLWNYEPSSWLFGTSSITRMEIEADGDLHAYYNVGIGATPSYPLDITANGSSLYGAYIDQNKADAGTVYGLSVDVDNTYTGTSAHTTYGIFGQALNNGGTTSSTFGVRGLATGTSTGVKYGVYGSTGGSGTRYAGYFAGDVYCTGSYLPSDESLKRNVLDFNGALSKLVSLPVKEYEYQRDGKFKNMNLPQGRQVGIMAQDMENIFPELTKENQFNLNDDPENPDATLEEDLYDFKSVNYVGLIPITIKAMQEQQAQIETLKVENEELKRKFEQQQNQIDELRALIQQD